MFTTSSRSSWLCRDEADRERVVDMERRLKPVRTIAFAILAGALLISGHWIGWWTLIPLVVAIVGFAIADRTMATAEQPELVIAGAWILSQVVIASSIALSGGAGSPAVSWLAIPVVTLGARFTSRGVAAGLVLTALLMVAVTLGLDGSNVANHPQTLIFPPALP